MLLEDQDGSLWLGTQEGLGRLADGHFSNYAQRDGLSDDVVTSLWEDGEGSLWGGTLTGGLNRFRSGYFTTYAAEQGLSGEVVRAVLEGRDGSLWIGTEEGGLNGPRDEVLRRSEMSAGRDRGVPRLRQHVSEPIQQRSPRAGSQRVYPCG